MTREQEIEKINEEIQECKEINNCAECENTSCPNFTSD